MKYTRIVLVVLVLAGALSLISWMFYQKDWKYLKPTPVPEGFQDVALIGTQLSLPATISQHQKPLLLHFYNPYCQCSKFNATHFAELVSKYQDRMTFYVVMQSDQPEDIHAFSEKYHLDVPVVLDHDGTFSEQCGIYATPQAVILDQNSYVYYKGNYNRARFCDSDKTAFAHQAIEHLLAGEPLPAFSEIATTPFGCALPQNE
jgi:peroxiredoxin